MKKLYVLAALLMASTAAHAGNSIAFEINGNGVRVEVPKNCDSLSCLRISAPGLSGSGIGFKDKSDRFDDDDVAVRPDPPAPKTAPAPVVQAATPQPAAPDNAPSASTTVASPRRREPCGPNLCGYAVKSGEKILIDMKPSDTKWTGRIHDPDSDRDYDSTIAMKGPNAMRVQGCAFGGMFCGGQTWKRVS
jgi:hypothetical protein